MFSLSVLVLMMSSLAGVFQTYKLSQKTSWYMLPWAPPVVHQ